MTAPDAGAQTAGTAPEPLARGDRARVAHETLQREILSLALAPGAPLDETVLARRFGMSRSPVREALNRLAAQGLVVLLPNRSTLVAPLDLAQFPRYVEALDLMQRINTRLAAARRTPAQIDRMKAAAAAFDASLARYDHLEMSALNKDFHMAVAEAGGNPYLIRDYAALLDEGRRILHLQFRHLAATTREHPLAEDHHRMIAAIAARDAEEADRLARRHTAEFHARFLRFLSATGTGGFRLGPGPADTEKEPAA